MMIINNHKCNTWGPSLLLSDEHSGGTLGTSWSTPRCSHSPATCQLVITDEPMMEVINDGHKGKGDLILLLHKYCLVQVQILFSTSTIFSALHVHGLHPAHAPCRGPGRSCPWCPLPWCPGSPLRTRRRWWSPWAPGRGAAGGPPSRGGAGRHCGGGHRHAGHGEGGAHKSAVGQRGEAGARIC